MVRHLALCIALIASPAVAQTPPPDFVPPNRAIGLTQLATSTVTPVSSSNPLPVYSSVDAPYQGVVAITPGTPTTAQRSLGFICTTAGNVTLTLADASTITLPISVGGFTTLPFAVTNVTLGSGTAATFWGLK